MTILKIVLATDLDVLLLHVPSMEEDCVKIGSDNFKDRLCY